MSAGSKTYTIREVTINGVKFEGGGRFKPMYPAHLSLKERRKVFKNAGRRIFLPQFKTTVLVELTYSNKDGMTATQIHPLTREKHQKL